MRLLFDTHILVWLATDLDKLNAGEQQLIGSSDEQLVSALSIWELRLKQMSLERRGKRKPGLTPDQALRFCNDSGFLVIDPNSADYAAPLIPVIGHHDPFDEMLLVHAACLGARLLTRDRLLLAHPIAIGG